MPKLIKPNFRRFHLLLKELNVDTEPLYRKLGIYPRDFADDSRGIDMALYLELLRQAAKYSEQPCLGVSIGLLNTKGDLGVMGYMVQNAPNFEKALEIIESYLELVAPGAKTLLIKENDLCTWTYEIEGFTTEQSKHDIEGTIVQFVEWIRSLFPGERWLPKSVYFQHTESANNSLLHQTMDCKISFEHYFNGISFPRELLFLPMNDADPQLLSILESQVQGALRQLRSQNNLLERLIFLISSSLGKANITIDCIAPKIGMSIRTLGRRLEEYNTTYSEVRDTIISKLAKEALSVTTVSISQLALQLGYADASAFIRAFKRLSGKTPLQYRRMNNRYSA